MLKLFRYLKNYKKESIIGPLFKLIEACFELAVPLVMANIIDVGIKNQDKPYIYKMGGVLVLLADQSQNHSHRGTDGAGFSGYFYGAVCGNSRVSEHERR